MHVSAKLIRLFAAMGCMTAVAATANAAILDFTDTSGAGNGATSGNFAGTTYQLSTDDGTITFNGTQDGSTCDTAVLACTGDGVGIGDDEVSAVAVGDDQELTITFGNTLTLDAIYLLDLFTSTNGNEYEQATVTYDGGTVVIDADPDERPNGDSGYRAFKFTNPIMTSFLTFSAPTDGSFNDQLGVNDYAVAGISAVPLPAALPIFGTGLGLIGLLRWWRRRRVTVA